MLKLIGLVFPGVSLIRLGIYAALALGAVGTVTGGYFYWRGTERMIGWNNAMAYIEKQNAAAKVIAEKAQMTVNTCFDSGGSWNVSTGACDR